MSYVLNGSPVTLPDATRRRVLDAMDELGYVPHGGARALRLDRTMTLALVIPDITNPYYPAVERGLQDSAEAAGYQLITYNTDGVAAKERKALRSVRETRADGAVIYDFHLGPEDYRPLLDAGTALAMVVSTPGKVGDLPIDHLTVGVSEGVALITRYLIERGYASARDHRRFARFGHRPRSERGVPGCLCHGRPDGRAGAHRRGRLHVPGRT